MATTLNLSYVPLPNCSLAQNIVTNKHFRISVIIEAICGGYAFVFNFLLLAVGWRVLVFSPNLRLLLGHLSFVLAWYGLGGLVKGVYLLGTPPCDLVITVRNCRVLEVITTNIAMVAMFFSLSALCIERLYATIRYRRYDRTNGSNVPWVAIISILIIWAAALTINLTTFASIIGNPSQPICESSVFASRNAVAPYLIFYLILEVLAVFATLFIYFFNKHMLRSMVINRALYDLSSRFQVDQNVQVNDVLLPSMILHLLCFLPNYALMLLFFDFQLSYETKATLLHISYLWRQVYAGVHPTLAFAFSTHLKQQLCQNVLGRFFGLIGLKIGMRPKTTDVGLRSKKEGDAHFKHLEEMWSGKRPIPAAPFIKLIRPRGYIVETSL